MVDMGASVLARLKRKATESGRSYQLCLQLFCQEEFLRRLEKSKYSDNFVLKGGLFIYSITNFDSRVTVDVDFLLRKIPNKPEQLKEIFEDIVTCDMCNDYITFEVRSVTPISVAKKYAGVRIVIVAYIKNTRTPFSIDLGVGDIIVPQQEKKTIPTQLDGFISPNIYTYSIETTIAEKLDAILSLMEFSSRMKYYYDLYYLANKFNFDGNTLVNALNSTFKNRERNFTDNQFRKMLSFNQNNDMQKKWNAFSRKINTKIDSYETILNTIDLFLEQPYLSAIHGNLFQFHWVSSEQLWIPD